MPSTLYEAFKDLLTKCTFQTHITKLRKLVSNSLEIPRPESMAEGLESRGVEF